MPIDWSEPFELTLIEAMACGTPVIVYGYNSVPETSDDSAPRTPALSCFRCD